MNGIVLRPPTGSIGSDIVLNFNFTASAISLCAKFTENVSFLCNSFTAYVSFCASFTESCYVADASATPALSLTTLLAAPFSPPFLHALGLALTSGFPAAVSVCPAFALPSKPFALHRNILLCDLRLWCQCYWSTCCAAVCWTDFAGVLNGRRCCCRGCRTEHRASSTPVDAKCLFHFEPTFKHSRPHEHKQRLRYAQI